MIARIAGAALFVLAGAASVPERQNLLTITPPHGNSVQACALTRELCETGVAAYRKGLWPQGVAPGGEATCAPSRCMAEGWDEIQGRR